MLLAADESKHHNRDVQQTAVSFAVHDTLVSVFLEEYPNFDASMIWAEDAIGARNVDRELGRNIGEWAAEKIMIARTADGHTKVRHPPFKSLSSHGLMDKISLCQPSSSTIHINPPHQAPDLPFGPLAPNARFIRPFGGIDKVEPWIPPPDPRQEGYEEFLTKVKEMGMREGSTRTEFETEVHVLLLPIIEVGRSWIDMASYRRRTSFLNQWHHGSTDLHR
jgi:hypothetical protein